MAEPFTSTRHDLERRKAEGLHGGMNFTYRKPERSTDPRLALPDAHSLVVAARSYRRGPRPEVDGPVGTVARYAWVDHYAELRAGLTAISERLREEGWRTRVLADDNALVDREAARRAGLGWYGKNANLLLPGQGSWFVLGSVVTDAPLATHAAEPVPDGCGTCTRCLDGCPTGAIVAPGVVDARRCLAWLLQTDGPFPREHRVALRDRIYGCDDCQEVCPPNRRAARLDLAHLGADRPALDDHRGGDASGRTPGDSRGSADGRSDGAPSGEAGGSVATPARAPGDDDGTPQGVVSGGAGDPARRPGSRPEPEAGTRVGSGPGEGATTHVDLVDLLAASDDELLARHGRWYIAKREARYLRRNALVVLGNVADPGDPRVIGALRGALAHDDPLVRGHAVWAARRMGRSDLVPADDADPGVREELTMPVEERDR